MRRQCSAALLEEGTMLESREQCSALTEMPRRVSFVHASAHTHRHTHIHTFVDITSAGAYLRRPRPAAVVGLSQEYIHPDAESERRIDCGGGGGSDRSTGAPPRCEEATAASRYAAGWREWVASWRRRWSVGRRGPTAVCATVRETKLVFGLNGLLYFNRMRPERSVRRSLARVSGVN